MIAISTSIALLAVVFLGAMAWQMRRVIRELPILGEPTSSGEEWPEGETVSVIVPACNEEAMIDATVRAILSSTSTGDLEVIVVDDQSSDRTAQAVEEIVPSDSRLKLLRGKPRPPEEIVLGKNWACRQGAQAATGKVLLFVDADFRIRPGCIESALRLLRAKGGALLGVMPEKELTLACEWMVEPQLTILHLTGPWLAETSKPERPKAFTPGWFMLFDRAVYEKIGGHWEVRGKVLEDLALGERVKAAGGRVIFALAPKAAQLHLYDSWREMREGYTKNFFCGMAHNVPGALVSTAAILLIFDGPWIGLLAALLTLGSPWWIWLAAFSVGGVALQFLLRLQLRHSAGIPLRRFWMVPIGGFLLAWINLQSMTRHLRGRVTWKGRPIPEH